MASPAPARLYPPPRELVPGHAQTGVVSSTEEEIESVTKFLKPEYSYKLSTVTLEDFVNTMIHSLPSYASVYEKFRKRYLDFEKLS